uniref:Uncharacterized protein n=1 Tax=Corethron hystrix TaxID=216773 RepID=A0A7S1G005_9STRA
MSMNYDTFPMAPQFTNYAVDLYFPDVPIFGKQGVTIASNTVDFLAHPQIDHGIDTLYWKLHNDNEDDSDDEDYEDSGVFDLWSNYWNNTATAMNVNRYFPDHDLEIDSEDQEDGIKESALPASMGSSSFGTFMILEAENTHLLPSEISSASSTLRDRVSTALKKATLTIKSVQQSSPADGPMISTIFLLQEGYVVARA